MNFETQIDNFNEEMLQLSRQVKQIQNHMSELYYHYLGARILKWENIIFAIVAGIFQLTEPALIVVSLLLSCIFEVSQRAVEDELNKLTDDYDDKIMEVISCQEKKKGLAEVWEKDEKETLMTDKAQEQEYNKNMPKEAYITLLLEERASLQPIQEEPVEKSEGKSLRKIFK